MPAPKLVTRLPLSSNLSTDGSDEPAQLFTPQRSATQMLFPSLSIATALVEPQVRPAGSFAQSVTVRYGFGKSFTAGMVADDCADSDAAG